MNANRSKQLPIIATLDDYLKPFSTLLNSLCNIYDARLQDWHNKTFTQMPDKNFLHNLLTYGYELVDYCWLAVEVNSVRSEIRQKLSYLQNDRHVEVYFTEIRDSLTELEHSINLIENYNTNEENYSKIIDQLEEECKQIASQIGSALNNEFDGVLAVLLSLRNEILLAVPESYHAKILPETLLTLPQPTESEPKRSKKKTPQLTTKQQMIMLDLLGFLNVPILASLTTEQKGVILANLLNRSEQEVRGMLTYWNGKSPRPDYDCSNPDDQDKVIDFLLNNNVNV